MKKIIPAGILMAGLLTLGAMEIAQADEVMFTPKWKALEFFRIPATEYKMEGATVEITARQSSSVTYSPLHKADWSATKAAWDWDTRQSVPPTNLAKKGNDDRNIAIYFVFLDKKVAEKIGQTASLRRLLTSRSARIIVYAFGGDKPVNTIEPNPYLGIGASLSSSGGRPLAHFPKMLISRQIMNGRSKARRGHWWVLRWPRIPTIRARS